MPSSKPAPFSFVNMDELRDQLQFIVDDLYSKIDFALGLDGKGIMAVLQYGGLGRDLSAVNAILGVAGGESIDVVPLNTSGGLTDVATLNASLSAHGFLKKLSGNAAEFMNGEGNWAVPGKLIWDFVAAPFTCVKDNGYLVNTSGGGFTLTLPALAATGDTMGFIDYTGSFDSNNLVLARNGLKIMGLAEDMTVSTKNAAFYLVYANAATGWRII